LTHVALLLQRASRQERTQRHDRRQLSDLAIDAASFAVRPISRSARLSMADK